MSPSQVRPEPSPRSAHGSWTTHVHPHDALADPLPLVILDTSSRPVVCSGLAFHEHIQPILTARASWSGSAWSRPTKFHDGSSAGDTFHLDLDGTVITDRYIEVDRVLAAKAAVVGAAALVAGEAAAFLSFFAGGMTLRHDITAPALSQPGVLRAIVLTGASLSLAGLFGLGLGAIIRHTAAAITVVVGIVFVSGTFIGQSDFAIRPYLPLYIVSHSLGATGPACLPGMASCWLSPWSGLGLLAGYAAMAMLLGGLILARRDA
jgi:hypothetical protein